MFEMMNWTMDKTITVSVLVALFVVIVIVDTIKKRKYNTKYDEE